MIDMHNHTLFGVDDGPDEIELSVQMLKHAESQGITDIILTPHYRKGMFAYDREVIDHNLAELRQRERQEDIRVKLHLGCEIHYHSNMLDSIYTGRVRTLAGSGYVLTEYSGDDSYDKVCEMTHRLLRAGYYPVIAHVERISCLRKKPKLCGDLQDMGAMIQCNAQAVLGAEGFMTAHFTEKLLKNNWVDLVASDSHNMSNRPNTLRDAWKKIRDKYGRDMADDLFIYNPERILEDN